MDKAPGPAELQAIRFVVMDEGYKAAGKVAALMLDALREHHPDRANTLNAALGQGMRMAVQFQFGDESRAVLQIVDDYGETTNLAAVPVVIRSPSNANNS